MVHGFNPRLPIGVALSAASAAAGFLLGADLNAVMVALVGGVAAVLVVAARGEDDTPDQRMAMDDGPLARRALSVQSVIEGIGEPLLVVSDGRVACANRAACVLLGAHIVGEDVRLAIRHPAAAERLLPTGAHDGGRDGPVHLVGLGAREQHWEMRVHPIDAGRAVGGQRGPARPGARGPADRAVGRADLVREPDRAGDRRGRGGRRVGGEHGDVVTGGGQVEGGGQPDDAGADDGDPARRRHSRFQMNPCVALSEL